MLLYTHKLIFDVFLLTIMTDNWLIVLDAVRQLINRAWRSETAVRQLISRAWRNETID